MQSTHRVLTFGGGEIELLQIYTLGSPLFAEAQLRVGDGRTLTLEAPQATRANKYVGWGSTTLNGATLERSFVTFDELTKQDTTIHFAMQPTPDLEGGEALKSWADGE